MDKLTRAMKAQKTNEEVLEIFRDWWSQQNCPIPVNGIERPLVSDDKVEACILVIRDKYAKRIDPVSLAESTLAELKEFKRELLKAPHDPKDIMNDFMAIEMFRSFRESALKARHLKKGK